MGEREIVASARVSNRMLERPAAGPAEHPRRQERRRAVAGSRTRCVELRHTVTELDPAKADLKGARKLLGMIPMGNEDRRATSRSTSRPRSSSTPIIKALDSGQDELRKDNAAIEQEKANLWAAMGKLTEYATLAKALDARRRAEDRPAEDQQPEAGRRDDVGRAVPDPAAVSRTC